MRYKLIADDGRVKKTLDIPQEILPIKGVSSKRKSVTCHHHSVKEKRKRSVSSKSLINGYNRNKRRSKHK